VIHQTDQVHQPGYILGPFDEKSVYQIGIVRGGEKGIRKDFIIPETLEAYAQRLFIVYQLDVPHDPRIEQVRNRHGVPLAFAILGESLLPASKVLA
jgi:hypothetical protein